MLPTAGSLGYNSRVEQHRAVVWRDGPAPNLWCTGLLPRYHIVQPVCFSLHGKPAYPSSTAPCSEQLQGSAGTFLFTQTTHRASNPATPHPEGLLQGVLSFPSSPSCSSLLRVGKTLQRKALQNPGSGLLLWLRTANSWPDKYLWESACHPSDSVRKESVSV